MQLVRQRELKEPAEAEVQIVKPSEANVERVDESGQLEVESNSQIEATSDSTSGFGQEHATDIRDEADAASNQVQQPADQPTELKVLSYMWKDWTSQNSAGLTNSFSFMFLYMLRLSGTIFCV